MSSKKKSQITTVLDDLRCEDPKRRLSAVAELKQVGLALGPARVRNQLLPFLAEFVDDQENIVLQLLDQLENFGPLVGGSEHEKSLISLLILFCKTDQKKQAFKACKMLGRILEDAKDLAVENIKKLMKTQMIVAKECAAQLICLLVSKIEGVQSGFLELYFSIIYTENPAQRIVGAKYLHELLKNIRTKEEIGKMIDIIYNEGDDLSRIYALKALIQYYDVNPSACLTKFKNLAVINSWRVNIKICENLGALSNKISKAHFKLIFEPMILTYMTSIQPQLRAASCQTLIFLAKNMCDVEHKSKMIPAIKKLAQDSVEFVKIELSKNILGVCALVNSEVMNQFLLPIIFNFVKETNSEVSLGVAKSFDYLASKISKQNLEERIIKPLTIQLNSDNWRIKCQIIQIFRSIVGNQAYVSQNLLKTIFGLTDDKIDAVRLKVNQLIIEMISRSGKQWIDQNLIPRVIAMKDSASYIKRQNLLEIIEKTASSVSDRTLKEGYQNVIASTLSDKVANVRLKSINVLKMNNKMNNAAIQKQLEKLKDDKDSEVRETVKKFRA